MVTQQPTTTLPGIHNDLELFTDRVVIRRKDVYSKFFHGDRTVPLSDIASVRLFECRFGDRGQLRLELVNTTEDAIVLDYKCEHHQAAELIRNAIQAVLENA